jgi:hypothetical protein
MAGRQRLYETEPGQEILLREEADSWRAAAHVLGEHISGIIKEARLSELAERWPGSRAAYLTLSMTVVNATDWSTSFSRRQSLVEAMERGSGLSGHPGATR